MKIKTDGIMLGYTCPDCGAKSDQQLTEIVESGTAVCTECDVDMILDEHVSVRDHTRVDTLGKVLWVGTDSGSVTLCSETGEPLIDISEVSDDSVINVFFHPHPGAVIRQCEDIDAHEILLNRPT